MDTQVSGVVTGVTGQKLQYMEIINFYATWSQKKNSLRPVRPVRAGFRSDQGQKQSSHAVVDQ